MVAVGNWDAGTGRSSGQEDFKLVKGPKSGLQEGQSWLNFSLQPGKHGGNFCSCRAGQGSGYILPVYKDYVSNAKNIFGPWDTAECEGHMS